jgi:hypothetical protein
MGQLFCEPFELPAQVKKPAGLEQHQGGADHRASPGRAPIGPRDRKLPFCAVWKLDIHDLAHPVPPVGTPPNADLSADERVDRQRDDDGQWCIVI